MRFKNEAIHRYIAVIISIICIFSNVSATFAEMATENRESYTVTLTPTENGVLNFEDGTDKKDVDVDSVVKITAYPKAGYQLTSISVTDSDTGEVLVDESEAPSVVDIKADGFSFNMTDCNLTIKPVFVKKSTETIQDTTQDTELESESESESEETVSETDIDESDLFDDIYVDGKMVTEKDIEILRKTSNVNAVKNGASVLDVSMTISEALGITQQQWSDFINTYGNNDNNYFVGTPYVSDGYDSIDRSPNGWKWQNGTAGMQCTGFVWSALVTAKCGADADTGTKLAFGNSVPHMTGFDHCAGGWVAWADAHSVTYYDYRSESDLLNGGHLQKGDIVWGFVGNGPGTLNSNHHIMIYMGKDANGQNLFWDSNGSNSNGGNLIHAGITDKGVNFTYFRIYKNPVITYGRFVIKKSSATPEISFGNDCYSITGAEYGIYKDSECKNLIQSITIKNNEVNSETEHSAVSDTITLDAGTYYVKEISAPTGFALDTRMYPVTIAAGNLTTLETTDVPQMDPVPLLVEKVDADTGKPVASGKGSLKGAEYTAKFYKKGSDTPERTWVFATDKDGYIGYLDDYKVSGDELYRASDGNPALPMGTFTIQETKAPVGYSIDTKLYTVEITGQPSSEALIHSYNSVTSPEVPTKLVQTTAKDEVTNSHLGIPRKDCKITDTVEFKGFSIGKTYRIQGTIMDKETGKELLINGEKVTAEKEFTATVADGTVDVEFAFDASGLDKKDIVVFEKVYEGENEILEHENIDDQGQTISFNKETLKTTAKDKDTDSHTGIPQKNATVLDKVTYEGLNTDKTYKLSGILIVKDTGKPLLVNGKEVTAEKEFKPETADGTVELEFTFDASALKGQSIVVYESVYYNDIEVAAHSDISDKEQTIEYPKPEIKTTATDSETKTHQAVARKNVTISDVVAYKGLVSNKKYSVKGVLMDQATGKEILVDGKTVTAETTFTPKESSGTVTLNFTFDATKLKTSKVVVFENLYYKDTELTVHADIKDESQTVEFTTPEIKTSVKDSFTGVQQVVPTGKVTLIDTVSYKNLISNQKFEIRGVLMDKTTGKALKVDGKEVTGKAEFIPKNANGTVDVQFTFDASGLTKGQELVIFEKLYFANEEVSNHEDLTDSMQTVKIPESEIKTNATDGITDTNSGVPMKKATILDKITYKNLIAGIEYTVHGTLMDRETGEPLMVNGKEVTSELKFTPDTPNGFVTMTFEFDASALKGKTVVAFERLYANEKEICVHTDIDDKSQTIEYPDSSIHTKAVNKADGTNTIISSGNVTVTDTIIYKNLIPGVEYCVHGKLMDQSTGKAVLINGKEVISEKKFTPDKKDGQIDVDFVFNASGLKTSSIVIFESLYIKDNEVAVHTDINDSAQTIGVKKPSSTTTAPSTGVHSNMAVLAVLFVVFCIGAIVAFLKIRKK